MLLVFPKWTKKTNKRLRTRAESGRVMEHDSMPLRKSGEPLNEFIARFAGSKRERKKFTNQNQRLAVGYAEARERARARRDE